MGCGLKHKELEEILQDIWSDYLMILPDLPPLIITVIILSTEGTQPEIWWIEDSGRGKSIASISVLKWSLFYWPERMKDKVNLGSI